MSSYKIRNNFIIKKSLVSTLSQLTGRLANFILPLLFLSKFGGSEASDSLFVAFAVVFFFGSTLSNAASDAFTPGLSNQHICGPDRKWLSLIVFISIFSSIFIMIIVAKFSRYTLFLSIVACFLVYVGLSSSLKVSKLYCSGDFLTPGVTWSFRWIAIVPIFLVDDEALAAVLFLTFILAADITRLFILSKRVKNFECMSSLTEKKVLSSNIVLCFMFSASLSGLNPLVDRFVASYIEGGAVSHLELIERIASMFLLIPTVGIIQVLNVEINEKIKSKDSWRYEVLLFKVLAFSTAWSLLCSLVLWALGDNIFSVFEVESWVVGQNIEFGLYILIAMAPALFIGMVCVRILLALNKGRLVLIISGASLLVNAGSSIPLGITIGVNGILLATIFTYSVTASLLIFSCSKSFQKAM